MTHTNAPKHFATTLEYELPNSEWGKRAHLLDTIDPAQHGLLDELRFVGYLLQQARQHDVLLLDSASGRFYPELLACIVLGFMPKHRRPTIVLSGDVWEPDSGIKLLLERVLIKLADRAVNRYAIFTEDEKHILPSFWGIDASKVDCCPFFYSVTEEDLQAPAPELGDYIFAGGNTHRNYEPLLKAAAMMPETKFRFVTSLLDNRVNLPENVEVGAVPYTEFVSLLRGAPVVVVPIKQGMQRSVGQQTVLNSMLLGKFTITTDAFGIRDYIKHGEHGLIVDGTPESYKEALEWAMDPANREAMNTMIENARAWVLEHFSYPDHLACLLKSIDHAVAQNCR